MSHFNDIPTGSECLHVAPPAPFRMCHEPEPVWWGAGVLNLTPDEAFVTGLVNSREVETEEGSYTFTGLAGQHLYWAWPVFFGESDFFFNTLQFINHRTQVTIAGVEYYVYRSNQPQYGTVTVSVTNG